MAARGHGIRTEGEDPLKIFDILAKLGEGSYGSVYKALDKRDGKIVAIKVLEIENDDIAELRKEINILKDCNSPEIVAYKGAYEKDNNIWIVMEYCGAGSVCDLMAICEKTLTEEQIAVIMKMSLKGLEYLHANKKIHRDIKSGNILLNHEGDCKLADFGVSAELTTTMAKRKTVIGTPYWMAPEVLQSTDYNGKADVWSLAITAIELAVGEPPHSNVHPMRAIFLIPTSEPPTLPNPEKWSKDFNDFLKVCLVKNPELRPSATELFEHPFIKKAGAKSIIASLVEECMKEIDDYREQEAKESEDGTLVSEEGMDEMAMDGGATLVFNGVGGAASATLVKKKKYKTTLSGDGDDDDMSGDATMVRPDRKEKVPYDSGTLVQKPVVVSASPAGGGGGGGDFLHYYRTGQSLDVDQNSGLLDLRMSLITLNKAYEDEMQALEAFYAKRRQQLEEMIAKKKAEVSK